MPIPSVPALMIEPIVRAALLEDLGRGGDLTTDAIVAADARTRTALVARQPGVLAGLDFALTAFRLMDPAIEATPQRRDGSRLAPGDPIATIAGPARGILTAERTALNFLCHLSGVASATRAVVDAISGHKARVCCTRKTMPGLRAAGPLVDRRALCGPRREHEDVGGAEERRVAEGANEGDGAGQRPEV